MITLILLWLIGANLYLLIKFYTWLNRNGMYWTKLYRRHIPTLILEAALWPIALFIWLKRQY